MPDRRPRVRLVEVADGVGLELVASLVRADAAGTAEFGGFYGAAPERLGPLLSEHRRAWLIQVAGEPVGFLDADEDEGRVGLSYFVADAHRRQGVARGAVGRLLGLAPFGDEVMYTISASPHDVASNTVARATGFRAARHDEQGDTVWERTAPRQRTSRDDPARYLRVDGRIDRYPAGVDELRVLLTWVAQQAMTPEEVLSEAEMNERLSRFTTDVAALRRHLVDAEVLERTRSGSEYARVASAG